MLAQHLCCGPSDHATKVRLPLDFVLAAPPYMLHDHCGKYGALTGNKMVPICSDACHAARGVPGGHEGGHTHHCCLHRLQHVHNPLIDNIVRR